MKFFGNDEKWGGVFSGVLVSASSITVAFGSTAAAQQAKCRQRREEKKPHLLRLLTPRLGLLLSCFSTQQTSAFVRKPRSQLEGRGLQPARQQGAQQWIQERVLDGLPNGSGWIATMSAPPPGATDWIPLEPISSLAHIPLRRYEEPTGRK